MSRQKSQSRLERHLLERMFDQGAFSDLAVVFLHPAFPFSVRFDLHKAIICQSPFFNRILQNIHYVQEHNSDHDGDDEEGGVDENDSEMKEIVHDDDLEVITTLKINLLDALSNRGFLLAPFQHIIRRKWQKSKASATKQKPEPPTQPLFSHILSKHIRFALHWMYAVDRAELVEKVEDEDTLRILAIAVLFELDDLAEACVERYTRSQISIDTIMRDLEHICQLPHDHHAYLRLRDAALLLLLRYGPENPKCLAHLPVDYMADVLSADALFVGCEYERYCLLRQVLVEFMQSVGKISWTPAGPVDQEQKRLSGFVRPYKGKKKKKNSDIPAFPPKATITVNADLVRSRKRKRIPSEELAEESPSLSQERGKARQRLARLSFSATVPFQTLVADASSGGVIDKATVLSYLLRTTVSYSNMTFEQLSTVRHDGIVDESIVFRALWQRKALERLLYSSNVTRSLSSNESGGPSSSSTPDDRFTALDGYFDVNDCKELEERRRILIGIPKFRFRFSVHITSPYEDRSWIMDQGEAKDNNNDLHHVSEEGSPSKAVPESTFGNDDLFDDDDFDYSFLEEEMSALENRHSEDKKSDEPVSGLGSSDNNPIEIADSESDHDTFGNVRSSPPRTIWRKAFYSRTETVMGTTYRVKVDAQVVPKSLVLLPGAQDGDGSDHNEIQEEKEEGDVLLCCFELQRIIPASADTISPEEGTAATAPTNVRNKDDAPDTDNGAISHSQRVAADKQQAIARSNSSPLRTFNTKLQQDSKIRYAIYCLNRHEGLWETDKVDPEDRVLVPVTEQTESNEAGAPPSGYVGQALIHGNIKNSLTLDTMVTLELFNIQKV